MVFVYGYRETVTGLDALNSIAVRMTVQDLLKQLEDAASDRISDEWDRYMSEKVSKMLKKKKKYIKSIKQKCVCHGSFRYKRDPIRISQVSG